MPENDIPKPPSSPELGETKPIPHVNPATPSIFAFIHSLSDSNPQIPAQVPKYIGQYEIVRELGRGGMGIVFLANQPSLNRQVALKLIHTKLGASPEDYQRFQSEAQTAASLQHPNIVPVYEVGEQEGVAFLAMEYVEGGSLHQHLANHVLSYRESAELVISIAMAMHYAHQKGIIHRDLKPANILLQRQETSSSTQIDATSAPSGAAPVSVSHPLLYPKVTDFGLAKRVNQGLSITATGIAVGTPNYMSPEQARDDRKNIGPPSDVYALGAILYELLTGQLLFPAPTPFAILEKVVRERPKNPQSIRSDIPSALQSICLKCLEKKPVHRYQTAEQLADDLRNYLQASEVTAAIEARGGVRKWFRRRPVVTGAIACVVVLAIALAASWFRQRVRDADTFNQHLKGELDEARREKAQQAQQVLAYKVEQAFRDGVALCAEGRVTLGVQQLRHAEKLADSLESPELKAAIGRSLAAWRREDIVLERTITIRGGAESVAYHPEGKLVAIGDREGGIHFYDPATGTAIGTPVRSTKGFMGGTGRDVELMRWCPDAKHLISGHRAGHISLWDVEARQLVGDPLDVGPHPATGIAFFPPGKSALVATKRGEVQYLQIPELKSIGEPFRCGQAGDRTSCAVRNDGNEIALGHKRTVRIFRRLDKNWLPDHTLPVGGEPTHLEYILGHQRLVIAGKQIREIGRQPPQEIFNHQGFLLVWDRPTQRLLPLPDQEDAIVGLAVSRGGGCFATATANGYVRVWDAVALQPLCDPIILSSPISAMDFHPDGVHLMIAERSGFVHQYRIPSPRNPTGPIILTDAEVPIPMPMHCVRFSADGKWLFTSTLNGAVLWPLDPELLLPNVGLPEWGIHAAAMSPNRRWLAFAGLGARLEIVDTKLGKSHKLPLPLGGMTRILCISPDSSELVVISENAQQSTNKKEPVEAGSWVLGLGTGPVPPRRILRALQTKIQAAVYDPPGKHLFLAGNDGKVRRWDVASDSEVGSAFAHTSPVTAIAVSPDGKHLFAGCLDGTGHWWNLETNMIETTIRCRSQVTSAAISPDGKSVVTGCFDGKAQVWDSTTGYPLGAAMLHADPVLSVDFHPNGNSIVT